MTKDQVLKHFGGAGAVARALGCSQPSVSNWGDRPPVLRQLQIERLTSGLLRAHAECDPYRVGVSDDGGTAKADAPRAAA